MRMTMLGFLSAATTDPTTPRSAAVATSNDKPLWIMFLFIFYFVFQFLFGSGNRCWLRDPRKPWGWPLLAERLLDAHFASARCTRSVIFKRSSSAHLEFLRFSKHPQSTAVCPGSEKLAKSN